MEPQTDLHILLKSMSPVLHEGEYVFCLVDGKSIMNVPEILMSFQEDEGITVILKKEVADELNLKYDFVASWITMMVHSSLSAVGFTAAFSGALAQNGISCNVVAACHHDHLFVNADDALNAMEILQRLSSSSD